MFDLGFVIDLWQFLWPSIPYPLRVVLIFGFGLSVLADLWALRWVVARWRARKAD